MNDDQIKTLIASCKAARRSKKPFHYFYCEQASDEEPLLMVGKRIPPAEVKAIRRGAKVRKFSQGTVHSSGSGLVFQTDSPAKLAKHITSVFSKRVPPLKKATVVGMDADIPPPSFVAGELEQADEELSEAVTERDETVLDGQVISEEVEQAQEAYQGQLENLSTAREDLRVVYKSAKLSKAQFEQAKEELPNLLEEIFNSGKKNAQLRQNYEQALKAMNLTEEERQSRIQAFEAQEKTLPSSNEAILLSIKENMQRRAEVAVAEKEVGVQQAAQKVAQKKVNQATVSANKALDALEDAIEAVPELKQLSAAADQEEAAADQTTGRVFALQEEITTLQERMRELSETLKNAEDPDLSMVRELAAIEQSLRSKEIRLDTLIDEAETLEASAREKRKALKVRTDQLADSNPELKVALEDQRQAKAALKTLVEGEAEADASLDAAERARDEAERRLRIQQLMRETKSLIDANRYFYEDLKGVNPRDAESVQQHRALLDNGGTALFERSRELYTALVKEGATQEELEEVFATVPSAWRPDALTEHMKWFKKLEDWEDAMKDAEKSAKMQEEIEKKLYGENVALVDRAQEKLEKVFESTESIRTLLAKVGKKPEDESTTVGSETVEVLEDTGLFSKMQEGLESLRSSEGIVAMSEIIGLINSGTELIGGVFDIRKAHKDSTAPKVDPRLDGLVQGDASYDQADDPLLQRMRDEKLLSAIAKLGEKGFEVFAELAGEILPGLGLAVSGKDLIKSVVEAGNRIANAILTSELLDEAQDSDSTAIEALNQARGRETQLAVKASVETAVNTLKTVGEIGKVVGLAAVGAGTAAGYAISLSGSALKLANTAGNAIVDFKIASEARKFYLLAKQGDAEGARKLFEYSRTHAKGLLAWMAKEGDQIAKKYVSMQGVSDDELAKTCPAVLQRFLLRNASEEGEQKTFTEWVTEKLDTFRNTISSITSWVGSNILTPAANLISKLLASATMPEIPGLVGTPTDLIQTLSDTLSDFAKKRAFLERGGKKNRKIIEDLDRHRTTLDQQAMKERDQIGGNLTVLSKHIDIVNTLLTDRVDRQGQPLAEDFLLYLKLVLSYLKSTLKTNLTTMDMLADLA